MINYDQEIYDGAINGGATPALASLITMQARHESNNYNSYQTSVNNNVFGFKYSSNSKYAEMGNISPEGNPYAHYPSLQYAILDYIERWMGKASNEGGTRLQEFNKIADKDTNTYARKLKSYGYYSTPSGKTDEQVILNYISGLNSASTRMNIVAFYFKNKKAINYGTIGILLIATTAYVYYLRKKKVF